MIHLVTAVSEAERDFGNREYRLWKIIILGVHVELDGVYVKYRIAWYGTAKAQAEAEEHHDHRCSGRLDSAETKP